MTFGYDTDKKILLQEYIKMHKRNRQVNAE